MLIMTTHNFSSPLRFILVYCSKSVSHKHGCAPHTPLPPSYPVLRCQPPSSSSPADRSAQGSEKVLRAVPQLPFKWGNWNWKPILLLELGVFLTQPQKFRGNNGEPATDKKPKEEVCSPSVCPHFPSARLQQPVLPESNVTDGPGLTRARCYEHLAFKMIPLLPIAIYFSCPWVNPSDLRLLPTQLWRLLPPRLLSSPAASARSIWLTQAEQRLNESQTLLVLCSATGSEKDILKRMP